ncbi:hypothetical protein [Homoserinibacter sp. YIM 151385]|uniref:hypothetical protein n=1 Tax=Homoserinibacter sp. YIM 151385 TaxID=2985506 RepID=UPI0022F04DF8|nr:hypothetical protein [Homoserinibacter sp. YIM 151385]WBU37791.1 hypothetical protein OF852_12860 [Homoserinibacter sp. YIM 151385]
MRLRSRALAAAALAAALALLAGCAPQPVPEPAPSASAEPAPSADPVADRPRSLGGLDCAALLGAGTIAAVSSQAEAARDSSVLAWSAVAARIQQSGGLLCEWSSMALATELHDRIQVGAMPDAAAEYEQAAAHPELRADARDEHGDSSFAACSEDGGRALCAGSVLVGTTWADIRLSLADADGAASLFDDAMGEVAAALAGAGAPADWTPAETAVDGALLCESPAAAERMSAILDGEAQQVGSGAEGEFFPVSRQRVDWAECGWQVPGDPGFLRLALLAGGAWWAEEVIADPGASAAVGDESAVEVTGAEAAALACGAGSCWGRIAVDGSTVLVTGDAVGEDREAFTGVLEQLAASLLEG